MSHTIDCDGKRSCLKHDTLATVATYHKAYLVLDPGYSVTYKRNNHCKVQNTSITLLYWHYLSSQPMTSCTICSLRKKRADKERRAVLVSAYLNLILFYTLSAAGDYELTGELLLKMRRRRESSSSAAETLFVEILRCRRINYKITENIPGKVFEKYRDGIKLHDI